MRETELRRSGVAIEAAGFFLAAALGRFLLRHVESRWQIVAWCVVAGLVALPARRGTPAARLFRTMVLCAAATVAVLAVKAYLEPRDVHAETRAAGARAKAVVRKIEADG